MKNADVDRTVNRGLEWLAAHQIAAGHWTANNDRYPTAMTALAGIALLCEGSTTTQGKYAANIRRAVDYLVSRSRTNGLIGDPTRDDRYTYGHGFSMLFLSQVLGEEEDAERREQLIDVLTRAVVFTGEAQTEPAAGATSAPRTATASTKARPRSPRCKGCAAAATPAFPCPRKSSTRPSNTSRTAPAPTAACSTIPRAAAARPAITAAAIACLFNAGEYDSEYVPKLLNYCHQHLDNISNQGFGHWHYAHYYYSQVLYREGGKTWEDVPRQDFRADRSEAGADGSWNQGYIGPVYTTAINLTILQLPKGALPIYQR